MCYCIDLLLFRYDYVSSCQKLIQGETDCFSSDEINRNCRFNGDGLTFLPSSLPVHITDVYTRKTIFDKL